MFSGSGQLLHGDPEQLQAELVYMVERTPGSVPEMWSHTQFQEYVAKHTQNATADTATKPTIDPGPVGTR